jgi:hypothetical protein
MYHIIWTILYGTSWRVKVKALPQAFKINEPFGISEVINFTFFIVIIVVGMLSLLSEG